MLEIRSLITTNAERGLEIHNKKTKGNERKNEDYSKKHQSRK